MIIKLLVITQLANIILTYFQLDLGIQYVMVSLSFIPNMLIVFVDHRNVDNKETYIKVCLFGLSIFVYTLEEPAQFQIFTAIYINLIYALLENRNILELLVQGATYIYILIFTTQSTKTDITRSVVCCILLLIYFYPKIEVQIMNHSFTLPNSATHMIKEIFTPQTSLQTFGLLVLDPNDLSVIRSNDSMIQIERMLNQNMTFLIKCLKILQIDKEAKQRLDLTKENKVQFIWLTDLLKRIKEKNNIQEIQILDVENEAFKEFLIKIYYTGNEFLLHFYQCVHRDNYLKRQYTQAIMSQIFKTLSHEIGTALNFILALAQSENDPQSINQNLKLIENTGKIMHNFVLDMVDFSDQMSKKFRLCIENINLESLLQEVCDMFRATLAYKGLKIEYIIECSRELQFYSDPRRIKQILINLISNSQKFSFSGIIQVIVKRDNIKNIEFQVKDEGIGMSDQELEDLRKKLSNVDMQKQISKNTAGFGLGTYLANQIAKSLSKNRYQNELGLKIEQQLQGLKVSFCVDFYEINMSKTISSTPSGMYFKNAYVDLRKSQLDNSTGTSQERKNLFRTRTKQNRQDTINHQRQYNAPTQSQGMQNQQSINSLLDHQNPKRENSLYIDQVLEKQQTTNKKNLLNQETLGFPRQQEVVFTAFKEEDGIAADPDYDDQMKRFSGISKSVAKKSRANLSGVQTSGIKIEQLSSNNYFDINEKIQTQEQICDKCVKFLIVDDEQINILGLKLMLQSLGYQSDCAYNGKDALSKINDNQLRHCQYYIIFMDINMPIMDGFEATKRILTEYSDVDYQIVACTAFTDAETKEKCYQTGMVQFINKPVNKLELKKIIDYYIRY